MAIVSRARGQRVVATAAAQAGAKLRDAYYGITHNHERREGVEFAEIWAPEGTPSWVFDREQLWNRVEAGERRKDAQLARAIEISLPIELDLPQCADLLRDFVQTEFVSKGMIADASIRRSRLGNPNAHLLLTLREAQAEGFGPKKREWNRKADLMVWRQAWANGANLHLARAGHAVRIDHRSFDEQQIELTPARRTGIGHALQDIAALPDHLQARFEEQHRIAHDNGNLILEDPSIAIRALARQRRSFSREDMRAFLTPRTQGPEQLDAALARILASAELVAVSAGEDRPALFTSRDLLEAEKALLRRAQNMSRRGEFQAVAMEGEELAEFLGQARGYWRERGKQMRHELPSPAAPLDRNEVLLVQDAEMIDLKTLERHVDAAERARASILLVADATRLQGMGDHSPMYALVRLRSS